MFYQRKSTPSCFSLNIRKGILAKNHSINSFPSSLTGPFKFFGFDMDENEEFAVAVVF